MNRNFTVNTMSSPFFSMLLLLLLLTISITIDIKEPVYTKNASPEAKDNAFPYKTTICCIPSAIHQDNLSYKLKLPLEFSISFVMICYQSEHQLKMCLLDFRGKCS